MHKNGNSTILALRWYKRTQASSTLIPGGVPLSARRGSGFWAEITSIPQLSSCESSLYGQVFVKEDRERTSTSRAQVSPPSFAEYLHPPPEHKLFHTDTQHRVSCCLCRCHCSFAFPSIRRSEGRKRMAIYHDFPQTSSLRLQALNVSQLLGPTSQHG